jgi:PKHD-type hydroxylase
MARRNRLQTGRSRQPLRDDGERTLLFDLDAAIQSLNQSPAAVQLTGVYHNLVRRWAEI